MELRGFVLRILRGRVCVPGITRSAARGTSLGLGVRVQRGDATGYAFVEDLSWDAMRRAAETAARIAGGTPSASVALAPSTLPDRYALERLTLEVDGREARAAPAGEPRGSPRTRA